MAVVEAYVGCGTGEPVNISMFLATGRDFEGHINIGRVTDAERCFVCSCVSLEASECLGMRPRTEWMEEEEGMQCLKTDWQYECFNTSALTNASTAVSFETPQSDRFLQFPAASGKIISTGLCVLFCNMHL